MRTSANKLRMKKGHATFVVEIKSCENESWQGVITWVEAQRKETFRSALELLKMIDSAVDTND